MTRQEFRDKIKRKLGYPLVKVELHNDQLDDCIDDATKLAVKFGYDVVMSSRWYVLQLSAGVQEYSFPSSVSAIEFYTTISDVSTGINTLFTVENYVFGQSGWLGTGGFDMQTYHQTLDYLETLNRYTSNKFTLEYMNWKNTVYVQPTPTSADDSDDLFLLLKVWVVAGTEYIYNDLNVQNIATGKAMQVLGKIRGKYSGYPLPGMQGASFDASGLVSEGIELEEKGLTALKEQSSQLEPWLA